MLLHTNIYIVIIIAMVCYYNRAFANLIKTLTDITKITCFINTISLLLLTLTLKFVSICFRYGFLPINSTMRVKTDIGNTGKQIL